MKRIVLVLTMAFVLVAMVVATAMPAFADSPACEAQEKQNWECQGSKLFNNGGKFKGKFTGS